MPFGPRYQEYEHPFATYEHDYESEERAALAHLRSIQQRRQLAEATTINQEAASAAIAARSARAQAQAEAQAQREASIRLAAELHRQRDLAIAKAIQEKQELAAIARAQAHARAQAEQQRAMREKVIIEAIRAEEQQQQQQQHRQRQAAALIQQAAHARQVQEAARLAKAAAVAAKRAEWERAVRKQAGCAAKYAANCAKSYVQGQAQEHGKDLDQLNNVLGSLFGINLVSEFGGAKEEGVKEKEEKEAEPVKQSNPSAESYVKAQAKEQGHDLLQLSDILESLLGINLVSDNKEEKHETKEKVREKSQETNKAPASAQPEKHVAFEQPAEAAKSTEEKPAEKKQDSTAFPENINDLLTQFLGLRVEPTAESRATGSADNNNHVPHGLNELLSQFGLVFEPEVGPSSTAGPSDKQELEVKAAQDGGVQPAESATVSGEPTAPKVSAAKDEVPTTIEPSFDDPALLSLFGGKNGPPPFIRDLLRDFEPICKAHGSHRSRPACHGVRNGACARGDQCCRDKGKRVAEGEKAVQPTPSPTPAPAPIASPTAAPTATEPMVAATASATPPQIDTLNTSTASLSKLSSLASELSLVLDSFTFPAHLSFGPNSTHQPSLLFNKTNSAYHAQANKLLQLLLAADGIPSGGDREVRNKRKEVVRHVEKEIEQLEKRRDEVWQEFKARRESGEVLSEDEETRSTGTTPSLLDHEEVRELESDPSAEGQVGKSSSPASTGEVSAPEPVEGFEVPAQAADQAEIPKQSAEVETTPVKEIRPAEAVEGKVEDTKVEEPKAEKMDDEFELL